MIQFEQTPIAPEQDNKVTNWFNQGEADTVKRIALDLQTMAEVEATQNAGKYNPGEQGHLIAALPDWEKARRYKIFLEVFDELKHARKRSKITLKHTHA